MPGPGEPGFDTWQGDSWKTGGASIWLTGSYDPELNLTYWGVGNPGPDWNGDNREGDNLYSNSVVALDADTGKLKWHFQFSPHDEFDYDAVQIPVLADAQWQGQPRKLMYFANRNGYFYVLDRATGQFLSGKPFVEVNWASGLDPKSGRPDSHRRQSAERAARNADLSGQSGRHQLVFAVLQPAHRLVLHSDVGELQQPVCERQGRVRRRAPIRRRRRAGAGAGHPNRAGRLQLVEARGRLRRGARDRSEHRRAAAGNSR